MVDAIRSNPFVAAQAARQQAAPPAGAGFQSFLGAAASAASPSSGGPLLNSLTHFPPGSLPQFGNSEQDTAALQQTLIKRFNAAGIDTSQPIDLSVGADGNVIVKGDNPQKAAIEKLFKDNPGLANQYRQVAAEDSWAALGRAYSSYASDYEAAQGAGAEAAVFGKYEPLFNKISQLSGDLTLSGGTLSSDSLSYADSLFPKGSVG
jgi:hypothetical protein